MEIPFEYLLAGIESAHGTALNPPTHNLGLVGTVNPMMERYRPTEQRGKLAEYAVGGGQLHANNIRAGRPARQGFARQRSRWRQLLSLPGPECAVTLIRLALAILLILFHHLGKRGKR